LVPIEILKRDRLALVMLENWRWATEGACCSPLEQIGIWMCDGSRTVPQRAVTRTKRMGGGEMSEFSFGIMEGFLAGFTAGLALVALLIALFAPKPEKATQ
jgi:hypothetical protein